jgi:hypothetical protein
MWSYLVTSATRDLSRKLLILLCLFKLLSIFSSQCQAQGEQDDIHQDVDAD